MAYCTSCGLPIPEGQGSSCSMCYGDPWYGKDGYALRELERQQEEAYQKKMEEEQMWRECEPPPHKDDF